MRFTCACWPRNRRASAAASSCVSLMPSIITYSYVTRRPGRGRVAERGIHNLVHRIAPVQRHEDVAQLIARGVKRDRQRVLRLVGDESLHPGQHAARADRHVSRPKPKTRAVGNRRGRFQDAIRVQQRLAHAHEHDVGQSLPHAGQPMAPEASLIDDLGGRRDPARNPSHPSRRTDSRRHSLPGSRCTRWPAHAASRAPGSASAPTPRACPSSSRCSAFWVSPLSAGRISVSARVLTRKSRGQLVAQGLRERVQLGRTTARRSTTGGRPAGVPVAGLVVIGEPGAELLGVDLRTGRGADRALRQRAC